MSDDPIDALRDYVRAFESMEPSAVVPFYHLPSLFIGPPGVTVIADDSARLGMATLLMEHARSQDYRRTEILDWSVKELGRSHANITGIFVRFNSTGKEIGRFGFAYTLRRENDGWKIVVALAHEPPA